MTIEATSPNVPGRPQGARAGDDDGDLRVPGVGVRRAAGEAGLASGRQQAARLGAGMGRPVAAVHRRQGHAARQRQAAARGEVQGLPEPPETLPRSPGHWVEWVNYAKGIGRCPARTSSTPAGRPKRTISATWPTGPGKKIEWDYKNLRAKNAPEAAPFIKRPEYRKGWDDILKVTHVGIRRTSGPIESSGEGVWYVDDPTGFREAGGRRVGGGRRRSPGRMHRRRRRRRRRKRSTRCRCASG